MGHGYRSRGLKHSMGDNRFRRNGPQKPNTQHTTDLGDESFYGPNPVWAAKYFFDAQRTAGDKNCFAVLLATLHVTLFFSTPNLWASTLELQAHDANIFAAQSVRRRKESLGR